MMVTGLKSCFKSVTAMLVAGKRRSVAGNHSAWRKVNPSSGIAVLSRDRNATLEQIGRMRESPCADMTGLGGLRACRFHDWGIRRSNQNARFTDPR
jgi:hypothetical protein